MTVHSLPSDPAAAPQHRQARPDTTSPYDSVWTERPPRQSTTPLDRVMTQDGKIYVVLAVVLVIWAGLLITLFRTDRKIDRLERRLERDIPDDE